MKAVSPSRTARSTPSSLTESPVPSKAFSSLYQHSVRLGFSFTFSLHFLSLVYIFLLKSLLPNDMLHYYFQLRKISPFKTLSVHPYMDLDLIAFIHKKHSWVTARCIKATSKVSFSDQSLLSKEGLMQNSWMQFLSQGTIMYGFWKCEGNFSSGSTEPPAHITPSKISHANLVFSAYFCRFAWSWSSCSITCSIFHSRRPLPSLLMLYIPGHPSLHIWDHLLLSCQQQKCHLWRRLTFYHLCPPMSPREV